jgi:SHOCT-like domain
MADSRKKILEMLEKKKITTEEAYRLLSAVDAKEEGHDNTGHDDTGHRRPAGKGMYLRVNITPGEDNPDPEHSERVNIRVPMSLVRAGIKLTSLIPPEAMDKANNALNEKGINFDIRNIKPDDIEGLVDALGDMEIDIEGKHGEKVKVFVE